MYSPLPSRMRQLSIAQGHEMRRRRLAELGHAEEADTSRVHFPGCLVFHCFRGDEECEEPSPPEACLRAAEDGSCASAVPAGFVASAASSAACASCSCFRSVARASSSSQVCVATTHTPMSSSQA